MISSHIVLIACYKIYLDLSVLLQLTMLLHSVYYITQYKLFRDVSPIVLLLYTCRVCRLANVCLKERALLKDSLALVDKERVCQTNRVSSIYTFLLSIYVFFTYVHIYGILLFFLLIQLFILFLK